MWFKIVIDCYKSKVEELEFWVGIKVATTDSLIKFGRFKVFYKWLESDLSLGFHGFYEAWFKGFVVLDIGDKEAVFIVDNNFVNGIDKTVTCTLFICLCKFDHVIILQIVLGTLQKSD